MTLFNRKKPKAPNIAADVNYRRGWKKIAIAASAVVAVVTVSALILPGITFNRRTYCGMAEHTHGADCYSKPAEKLLICDEDMLNLHSHKDSCYDDDGNVICGYADFVLHKHNGDCYDSEDELVCPLDEISLHEHTEDCYEIEEVVTDEGHTHTDECYDWSKPEEPNCGKEAAEGHTHTDDCYEITQGDPCAIEESEGHTHDDSCYGEAECVCGQDESEGHTHTDDCYSEEEVLDCDLEETDGHTHDDGCYEQDSEPSCGEEESDGHSHDDGCYDEEGELVCGEDEYEGHSHDDSCYGTDSEPDCGMDEVEPHTHDESCYTVEKTLACAEEETEGHTHTDECLGEAELVCDLDETEGHTHTDECSGKVKSLVCELEEVSAHEHSDSCYEKERGELTCTEQEREKVVEDGEKTIVCGLYEALSLHTHDESCFDEDEKIVCGMTELKVHVHTTECFEMPDRPLICGLDETKLHEHTESCFDEDGNQVCAAFGGEEHFHTEECYAPDEPVLICELPEHTHDEECTKKPEISGEAADEVDAVIAAIDALPENDDVQKQLSELNAKEDVEGYYNYYNEISARVNAVFDMYAELTESQKDRVTNAAKLMGFEWITVALAADNVNEWANSADMNVTGVKFVGLADGTPDWDTNDEPGNDSGPENKLVRTYDTVTYSFEVDVASVDTSQSYKTGLVDLEIYIPHTSEQAEFVLSSMGWLNNPTTHGGKGPEIRDVTEENPYASQGTNAEPAKVGQLLTGQMYLAPKEGASANETSIPGNMTQNLVIRVKNMKHGDKVLPTIIAYSEGTETAPSVNVKTNSAYLVEVSAVKRFNVAVKLSSRYKDAFNFNSGNNVEAYRTDIDYENTNYASLAAPNYHSESYIRYGRVAYAGIMLQIDGRVRDENGITQPSAKGFKGLEIPDGEITFDIKVSSKYITNKDNVTESHPLLAGNDPLMWSYDLNKRTAAGKTNADGRVLTDAWGGALGEAPVGRRDFGENEAYSCYDGGVWTVKQKLKDDGTTPYKDDDGNYILTVSVKDYVINMDYMPTAAVDGSRDEKIGEDYGVGAFSSGEIWLLQPFNSSTDGSNTLSDELYKYGDGNYQIKVDIVNVKVDGAAEDVITDYVTNDSTALSNMVLTQPGNMVNRILYNHINAAGGQAGVNTNSDQNGLDNAMPGEIFAIKAGFSYDDKNEPDQEMYLGSTFVKFYAKAVELLDGDGNDSSTYKHFVNNLCPTQMRSSVQVEALVAAKTDGTDWTSDEEMYNTFEDDLVYYRSPELARAAGKEPIGLLIYFVGPSGSSPEERSRWATARAKIPDAAMDYETSEIRQPFMMISSSRGWKRSDFKGIIYEQDEYDALSETERAEINERVKAGTALVLTANPNNTAAINETRRTAMWKFFKLNNLTNGFTFTNSNREHQNLGWFQDNPLFAHFEQAGIALPKPSLRSQNMPGQTYYQKSQYDENTGEVIKDHNSGWWYYGDSMLITKYKYTIGQYIMQRYVEGDEEPRYTSFDLDNGQRIIDIYIEPKIKVKDSGGTEHPITAEMGIYDAPVVTVTLPKNLAYIPGSGIYPSGNYVQSDPRGYAGEINGTPFEPEITYNNDGEQVLTWKYPNQKIIADASGSNVKSIFYRVQVNDNSNEIKTTSYSISAGVQSTNDIRPMSESNGNQTILGFQTVRGAVSGFFKKALQEYAEPSATIGFELTSTKSSHDQRLMMYDTMPTNGDEDGSVFTGTYTVASWKLDVGPGGNVDDFELYYTLDESYKNWYAEDFAGANDNDDAKINASVAEEIIASDKWTKATIASDGTCTDMNGKTPIAWAMWGFGAGNTKVVLQLKLEPDNSSDPNYLQINNYVNVMSSGKGRIYAQTQTVNRAISGLLWNDLNGDGLQSPDEPGMDGVTVFLWRNEKITYNGKEHPTGYVQSLNGKELIIKTGQQMSWLTGEVTDYVIDTSRRVYRYDLRGKTPENGILGKVGNVASGEMTAEGYHIVNNGSSGSKDGQFYFTPGVTINASDVDAIRIRLRSSVSATGAVYFRRTTDRELAEERKVTYNVVAGTDFTDCIVPMAENANWNGTIATLRIDMPEIADAEFTYQSIELISNVGEKAIQGGYRFYDLIPGKYKVVFNTLGAKSTYPGIQYYLVTKKNAGSNDSVDSDASGYYSNLENTNASGYKKYYDQPSVFLREAWITGTSEPNSSTEHASVVLPTAAEMTSPIYELEHLDAGVRSKGVELPATGGSGTQIYIYTGALLIMSAAAGYIIKRKKRRKEVLSK